MRLFFSFLFSLTLFLVPLFCLIEAGEQSRKEYSEMVKRHSNFIASKGSFSKGEIEILIDPQEMSAVEKATGREVGVLMRDRYWVWVNDACHFPNGTKGVYGRILWVKSLDSSYPGVVVMPITKEGKIVLNCNFRHATRSWEIELPRGLVEADEGIEAAAKRETKEETGFLVDDLLLLGSIPADTGTSNTLLPIFLAEVRGEQKEEREDSEAIETLLCLTLEEIKESFLKGYYEVVIRGEEKQIPFRDPFLAYAILIYELKQKNSQRFDFNSHFER